MQFNNNKKILFLFDTLTSVIWNGDPVFEQYADYTMTIVLSVI